MYSHLVMSFLYTSVIDSHIENSKNWNCEFTCSFRAHRHNAVAGPKNLFLCPDGRVATEEGRHAQSNYTKEIFRSWEGEKRSEGR